MNYIFDLIVDEQSVDTTNMSTNDPEEALSLFLDEFGWSDKIPKHQLDQVSVVLVGTEPEEGVDFDFKEDLSPEKYEDESKFMLSEDVHPEGIRLCYTHDEKDAKLLKKCKHFKLTGDLDDDSLPVECTHCWGIGYKSYCMLAVKRT